MSPGSFYHPPANQRYHVWNVAPGAPLHIPSPMASPYQQAYADSNGMDYFSVPPPPARVAEGYFPPVPVPSRLSKEVVQEEGSPPEEGNAASQAAASEEQEGPLGSLATKIGEQVLLGNGLEEEEGLAALSIGGPAVAAAPNAPQRTHSDGSQKAEGDDDTDARRVKDDDAPAAERRASWTPASERADFKKGL